HRFNENFEIGVPVYEVKVEGGRLLLNPDPVKKGKPLPESHSGLNRPIRREEGPIRVAGISTTMMTLSHPRYSTSEDLLQTALDHARDELGAETKLLRVREMKVRPCEGYYSKAAEACIWPCTITRGDRDDEMREIYEAMIHWADVFLVATPIRWGAASGLYYKMVERMNCIQNQITINNRVLIQNKVASFIITGGQDNVQMVAGQMLGFFAELGFLFPPFPFIGHSLGWEAEKMERNMEFVKGSASLHNGAKALVQRAIEFSKALLDSPICTAHIERAGRKASENAGSET
ncbi:MAG TPA: NAD(P)H-dependent oxidoreductase, partial [bacterium]|nr:NAD(P)H-dependent oxidoreductase [bacterium]